MLQKQQVASKFVAKTMDNQNVPAAKDMSWTLTAKRVMVSKKIQLTSLLK